MIQLPSSLGVGGLCKIGLYIKTLYYHSLILDSTRSKVDLSPNPPKKKRAQIKKHQESSEFNLCKYK